MSVDQGLGVKESRLRIFGRDGKAGNLLAKADVAEPILLISAFGDTIYVSR